MPKKIEKTVTHRRASWTGSPINLARLVHQYLGTKPLDEKITVRSDDLELMVLEYKPSGQTAYLHFVEYEKGARAAILREFSRDPVVDGFKPPIDVEFIRSQCFFLVYGNEILSIAHSSPFTPNRIQTYLEKVLIAKGAEPENVRFQLMSVVDLDLAEPLLKEGISHLDLNIGDLESNLRNALEDVEFSGSIQSIFGKLKRLLGQREQSTDEIAGANEINAKLVLGAGRSWDKPSVRSTMELGAELLQNGELVDDFSIITKSGSRISHKQITIKDKIWVECDSAVLDSSEIRKSLINVYAKLSERGIVGYADGD